MLVISCFYDLNKFIFVSDSLSSTSDTITDT